MCGIGGVWFRAKARERDQLTLACDILSKAVAHRGPDGEGIWFSKKHALGLVHRRLAIQDLSAAARQPMTTANDRYTLVYNGELYNGPALRKELRSEGARFDSRSDTEVLLHALTLWGIKALPRLDGMFAFALWDEEENSLLLARDRFGQKPLYLSMTDNAVAFSSELTALSALPWIQKEVLAASVVDYLLYQYIPAPQSIFPSIQKVEPGSYRKIFLSGSEESARYSAWNPKSDAHRTIDNGTAVLMEAVEAHRISDRPVGVLLSGGVDSSLVAALMRKEGSKPIRSYSIGYEHCAASEHIYARAVAEHLGLVHTEILLAPDMCREAEWVASYLDEPLADSAITPMYYLAEVAKRDVAVVLSGDGGDEMFGGYTRYLTTLDEDSGGVGPGDRYFSDRVLYFPEATAQQLAGQLPTPSTDALGRLRRRVNKCTRPLIHELRAVDAETYLPGTALAKVDRGSMRHALEVRAPLLSNTVSEFAEGLTAEQCVRDGVGKIFLKELAQQFLPNSIVFRKKQGFGVPDDLWSAAQLIPYLEALYRRSDAIVPSFLADGAWDRYLANLRMPETYSHYQVWGLLILELWLQRRLAGRALISTPPLTPQISVYDFTKSL